MVGGGGERPVYIEEVKEGGRAANTEKVDVHIIMY